uniref:Testis development-related protein n=2 Tax=Eptatretus burgeri TaxID=7764 RepID=A0A8C4QEY2_EPTBU
MSVWKMCKSKSLRTLISDSEEEKRIHICKSKDGNLFDDMSSSVSQLATKVHGARRKGWRDMTSLFSSKHGDRERLTDAPSPSTEHASISKDDPEPDSARSYFWEGLAVQEPTWSSELKGLADSRLWAPRRPTGIRQNDSETEYEGLAIFPRSSSWDVLDSEQNEKRGPHRPRWSKTHRERGEDPADWHWRPIK